MKLLKYLQGFRKGKEAHRLEKEAMQDSFLADALDGYDSTAENPVKRIEALRQQISARSVGRKRRQALGWSIAACLLLGVGISTYFLHENDSLLGVTTQPPSATLDAKGAIAQVRSEKEADTPQAESEVSEQDLLHIFNEDEKSASKLSAPSTLLADTVKVYGKITDRQGEPLIGASVSVKGTNEGAISDVDGNFALKVGGQKELVVDYIGYESVTLPADTGKNLLVAMNDGRQQLDEVVVVGYGAQKRNSAKGTVAVSKTPEKPQPVIGWKAYRKYLKENLQRPSDAECKQVKGKVVLTFRVNKTGRPKDITVKTPLCPSADKEAVSLIERGSDWTVGEKSVEVSIKF